METLSFPNFYNIVLMKNEVEAEKRDRYAALDNVVSFLKIEFSPLIYL